MVHTSHQVHAGFILGMDSLKHTMLRMSQPSLKIARTFVQCLAAAGRSGGGGAAAVHAADGAELPVAGDWG